ATRRARGIGQRWADPMGIEPPRRGASLRRDWFHHRPGRPDCCRLSLFRQATLSWTLPCDVLCVDWWRREEYFAVAGLELIPPFLRRLLTLTCRRTFYI